jgi:hypothetical protein
MKPTVFCDFLSFRDNSFGEELGLLRDEPPRVHHPRRASFRIPAPPGDSLAMQSIGIDNRQPHSAAPDIAILLTFPGGFGVSHDAYPHPFQARRLYCTHPGQARNCRVRTSHLLCLLQYAGLWPRL